MTLNLIQQANFGISRANLTGSSGVGYTLLDTVGNVVNSRTTVGVYQLATGSGIYAANVPYPDQFNGQILWDAPAVGIFSASWAAEQQNFQENDPRIADLYNISYGRWKISNNQMVFYKSDNATIVATFNLFDSSGNPTMDAVFDRQKV